MDKRWGIYDTDTRKMYKIFSNRNVAMENVLKDKRWFSGEVGIRQFDPGTDLKIKLRSRRK